jgi:hypothetical protein
MSADTPAHTSLLLYPPLVAQLRLIHASPTLRRCGMFMPLGPEGTPTVKAIQMMRGRGEAEAVPPRLFAINPETGERSVVLRGPGVGKVSLLMLAAWWRADNGRCRIAVPHSDREEHFWPAEIHVFDLGPGPESSVSLRPANKRGD